MRSILILGGTTEGRELAEALARRPDQLVAVSLAGRTANPVPMPVPVRIGGFGGAAGLAEHLQREGVDLLVDATHPFAHRISAAAAEASRQAGIALVAIARPGWTEEPGDRWTVVESAAAAIAALGQHPRRVLLALGRQEAHVAEAAPWHHYVVRSVEPVEPPLRLPDSDAILARGPFAFDDELALLRDRRLDIVVCKNSGGQAGYGKIAAARALGLEVAMVGRTAPAGAAVATVAEALALIDAHARVPRGA